MTKLKETTLVEQRRCIVEALTQERPKTTSEGGRTRKYQVAKAMLEIIDLLNCKKVGEL